MQDIEKIKTALKENGLRVTKSRIAVATILIKNYGKPLSSEEIYQKVKSSKILNCDQVSVYRTLSKFEELNLVKKSKENSCSNLMEIIHEEQSIMNEKDLLKLETNKAKREDSWVPCCTGIIPLPLDFKPNNIVNKTRIKTRKVMVKEMQDRVDDEGNTTQVEVEVEKDVDVFGTPLKKGDLLFVPAGNTKKSHREIAHMLLKEDLVDKVFIINGDEKEIQLWDSNKEHGYCCIKDDLKSIEFSKYLEFIYFNFNFYMKTDTNIVIGVNLIFLVNTFLIKIYLQ